MRIAPEINIIQLTEHNSPEWFSNLIDEDKAVLTKAHLVSSKHTLSRYRIETIGFTYLRIYPTLTEYHRA